MTTINPGAAPAAPTAPAAPAEPKPGSDEYNAAMAAKYRATQEVPADETEEADAPADGAADSGVPDKFKNEDGSINAEALLASYRELEAKLGSKADPAKAGQTPQIETPAEDKGAEQAAQDAGLNFDTLKTKFAETGKLDDTDYAALEKSGVPRAVVDEYLGLVKDRQDRATQDAYGHVGGEQAMNDLLAWAGANLSKDEIVQYNAMLASPGYKAALDTLMAKKAAATKTAGEPKLIAGSAGATTTTGYTDRSEMIRDMSDPRYTKDPLFRKEVERKMALRTF